jgi:hypothetical protein
MGALDSPKPGPSEALAEWLQSLDRLHRQVQELLRYRIEDGSMKCEFRETELAEENFGSYKAKILDIKLGNQLIYLEPLATLFRGCRRVEVVGPMGQSELILVDPKVKDATELPWNEGAQSDLQGERERVWKAITTKTPRTFVDLDRKVFSDILKQVFDAW